MSFSVQIKREDFINALEEISGNIHPGEPSEAYFLFEDGQLVIELSNGKSVKIPAEGEWPGEAAVQDMFLLGLARYCPQDDPVPITVQDERLYISGASSLCRSYRQRGFTIDLPREASLAEVLTTELEHTQDEIQQSGLAERMAKAINKRDRIIKNAADILEPLKVDEEDLKRFVSENLKKKK